MLFVIDLNYVVPLELIEAQLDAHRAMLTQHARAGTVIASGRKSPRTGGVIVTSEVERDAVTALIEEDPFHRLGRAEYAVMGVERLEHGA